MHLKNWFTYFFSLETDPESKTEAFDLLLKHDGDFTTADEAGKSVLDKAIEDYLASSYLGRYNTPRDFLQETFSSVSWTPGNI